MAPDYPYSLVSRELRGIIRGLLTKAAGSVELFFDHCLFTMLQELDKTPGESALWRMTVLRAELLFFLPSAWSSVPFTIRKVLIYTFLEREVIRNSTHFWK
jgi:hypothetical protein